MPAPRVIDTTPNKPEPTGVQEFFSNLSSAYKESQETDSLGKMIGAYKKTNRDQNDLEDLLFEISNSNKLGPKKRIEAMNSIQGISKTLNDRQRSITAGNKKTQSSKPIDPEQLDKIKQVRESSDFDEAAPSRKYQMFTDNGVSRENAESETKIYLEENKGKSGKKFGEVRENEVAKYYTDLQDQAQKAQNMDYSLEQSLKASEGDVVGPGLEAVMKSNPFGQLLMGLSVDEQELITASKTLLEGTTGLFGSKPTEREIFILLNSMLPAIGKTKEANKAGIDIMRNINNMKTLRADFANKITEDGNKYVPNLEQGVNKMMKPYVDQLVTDLKEGVKKFTPQESKEKIKVSSPDGQIGYMTQEQIDKAKAANVIFTPTK